MAESTQIVVDDPITGPYRLRFPVLGVVTSDIAAVSTTDPADIPGLSVQLEPLSRYAIDGYIVYAAGGGSGDIKFTFTTPPGASGHWFLHGQTAAASAGTGDMEFLQFSFGDEAGATGFGDGTCRPRGYVRTQGLGGALQWQFAQITSDAVGALVQAGSWIRATRMN